MIVSWASLLCLFCVSLIVLYFICIYMYFYFTIFFILVFVFLICLWTNDLSYLRERSTSASWLHFHLCYLFFRPFVHTKWKHKITKLLMTTFWKTRISNDQERSLVQILNSKFNTFSSPTCKIEVPERLTVSHEALIKSGLAGRCVPVPVREATDADILLVHRSVLMWTPWFSKFFHLCVRLK